MRLRSNIEPEDQEVLTDHGGSRKRRASTQDVSPIVLVPSPKKQKSSAKESTPPKQLGNAVHQLEMRRRISRHQHERSRSGSRCQCPRKMHAVGRFSSMRWQPSTGTRSLKGSKQSVIPQSMDTYRMVGSVHQIRRGAMVKLCASKMENSLLMNNSREIRSDV